MLRWIRAVAWALIHADYIGSARRGIEKAKERQRRAFDDAVERRRVELFGRDRDG